MRMGTLMEMGPGYFPLVAGGLMTVLGIAIVIMAFASSPSFESVEWRPMVAVLSSIAGFAYFMGNFGLMPAMAVGVALSALGDRTSRPVQTIMLCIISAVGTWLIFRVGLGLQMPGLKWPDWGG